MAEGQDDPLPAPLREAATPATDRSPGGGTQNHLAAAYRPAAASAAGLGLADQALVEQAVSAPGADLWGGFPAGSTDQDGLLRTGQSSGTNGTVGHGPPVPLHQAVVAGVQRLSALSGDGPVIVTLSPQELGTLRFEVQQTEHGLHLHLSVDQPATLDLLRRQGEQLLSDLRQQGFQNATLSFAGQGGQSGGAPSDSPPQQARSPLSPSPTDAATSPASQPASRLAGDGTLNLRL